MKPEEKQEWLRCDASPIYFTHRYGQIYDVTAATWIPFDLWPAQARALKTMQTDPLTIILKARQLGMTWLCLAHAIWLMLFRPQAEILLFSRRDDEAVHLLDERLKGMYERLPPWMQAREVVRSNSHEFSLSNGSTARAFPTSAGDSYTATLAIVDEADLVPDFNRLMRAVKPTIDTGGRMILLSRTDKTKPQSEFKRIYRAARAGDSPWTPVFLPWHVRPGRDAAWYAEQMADIQARTGSLDDLHEQYPETDTEALAPRTLDKRIPPAWVAAAFAPLPNLATSGAPSLPGLAIYQPPQAGREYVVGVDPAEGNPNSDDSALAVLDVATGEEVASLAGRFEPDVTAAYADTLGRYYNRAGIMVERNNHGHTVLLWLRENSALPRLPGHDGRPGWLSSTLGKAMLYDEMTQYFQACHESGDTPLHTFETYDQLTSIEGATLRAPEGLHDDRADAYALAHVGRAKMVLARRRRQPQSYSFNTY
jgi:hypothetical protein